jgi:hypothetical protein
MAIEEVGGIHGRNISKNNFLFRYPPCQHSRQRHPRYWTRGQRLQQKDRENGRRSRPTVRQNAQHYGGAHILRTALNRRVGVCATAEE